MPPAPGAMGIATGTDGENRRVYDVLIEERPSYYRLFARYDTLEDAEFVRAAMNALPRLLKLARDGMRSTEADERSR
jgi:hypothetical protein